jgi:hypothetical protein
MSKKSSKKQQKLYKMKGCSKKTRKNYLGGSADANLAYPSSNVPTIPNPFFAYTGKGGASCNANLTPSLAIPINTNGVNKTLPNTGPINVGGLGTPFLNPQGSQLGGNCGLCGLMKGGNKHRIGCKCSSCKMTGGNAGIPYPNGLVGSAWTPLTSGWPGVDGVQGGRNFLAPNNYHTDVQTAIISTGSQPPFSIGGNQQKIGKHQKIGKRFKTRKNQSGGTVSNFLGQDLINLGRQFHFGLGSAYNALAGYSAPVNPLPWTGQLANTPNLSTIRAASI